MTKPFISVVTLAYGSIPRLEEAIACFLAQDYDGPKQMVVLNSCPEQTLAGYFPNVKLVNLTVRPASLGACRNEAIRQADGDFIVVLDSDDFILPQHLTRYAEALECDPRPDWVRLTPTFYAERFQVKNLFSGWCNSVGFSKAAWEAISGYSDALSVGEDRHFVGRLSEKFTGKSLHLDNNRVTAIYSWDNGVYHISGKGDDKKGMIPAYDRAKENMESRMRRGMEPKGIVNLNPQLIHDPVQMVAKFTVKAPKIATQSVALVYVGRFGDIINILPIAQHINNTYGKPYLVVGRDFASLLDGVSYVEPYPVNLRHDQLHEAMAIARKNFTHVIQCQIFGQNYAQERLTESYNKESWRKAGFLPWFDDPTFVPLFDRRDLARERALYSKLNPTERPMILVTVNGHSSPFEQGPALLESIRQRWDDYLILNTSDVTAHRVYDLLGLIERAAAVVSIDTAILHLCAACRTPTVALVNQKEWQGTIPRFKHCWRLKYNEVGGDFKNVHQALTEAIASPLPPAPQFQPVLNAPLRRLFHALERHQDNPTEMRRKEPAVKSWDALYAAGVIPVHYREYKRDARKIGDRRDLPYLKDVLYTAMEKATDNDIIFWTNDDNWLHPELPNILRLHCSIWGCCSSQRCEFRGPMPNSTDRPEVFAQRGNTHMGRDVFAFTKKWLTEHWSQIPDFILGASDFDLALACMVRLQWGVKSNRQNMEQVIWPCELPRGYVSHQYHPPKWNAPNNRDTAPSQIWNRTLFRKWADKYLPELVFHANNTI